MGGVQCYGLGGVCKEDTADVRGASRTIGQLYAACRPQTGAQKNGGR